MQQVQWLDDSLLWPSEVRVGEIVYPARGTFGPRLQRNLDFVLVHTGHITVRIDGVLRFAPAGTIFVLMPGHEEYFVFAEENETWHSWFSIILPRFPDELRARLHCMPWPLPLSYGITRLVHEA